MHLDHVGDKIKITQLEARIKVLEEALRPFAAGGE